MSLQDVYYRVEDDVNYMMSCGLYDYTDHGLFCKYLNDSKMLFSKGRINIALKALIMAEHLMYKVKRKV